MSENNIVRAANGILANLVIEKMQVRSDNDIRLIAQELNRLQRRDFKRV